MAYTAHTWATGDTITADLLNSLENGVANEQVGPAGPAGKDGTNGKDGAKGADGLSVVYSSTAITDGGTASQPNGTVVIDSTGTLFTVASGKYAKQIKLTVDAG